MVHGRSSLGWCWDWRERSPYRERLEGILVQIAPADPVTFSTVGALLATVALLAFWIPARRAMKVDPLVALRYE